MVESGTRDTHRILVVGDCTVDWMLAVPTGASSASLQASYQWESRAPVQIVAQSGGAAMLRSLIAAAVDGCDDLAVDGATLPPRALESPYDSSVTRTYTLWQPYRVQHGSRDLVWRIHDFFGIQPVATTVTDAGSLDASSGTLVIDDANLGFRSRPEAWPALLRQDARPCRIILKMSNPLGVGPLWDELRATPENDVTAYCSVGDFRKEYAPIGQSLSWERIGSDVIRAVRARDDLGAADRVVVSIGMSGAVVVERDGPGVLVYDPQHQEGDWERSRAGAAVGLGSCITAALALAAARASIGDRPDWVGAVSAGISAGRALYDQRLVRPDAESHYGLEFPFGLVGEVLARSGGESFRAVTVPDDADWHILSTIWSDDYRVVAERIVVEGGESACRDVPIERIGGWTSIDRTEIESMRSIRGIIREYLANPRLTRPLSIAVFGPPGSGKSFAIKQMAREWADGPTPIRVLEVNLSQIATLDDLAGALQQVRDSVVQGFIPLVFWDEFDARLGGQELGWLSQFLSPMQDGVFVHGGIARPIGRAIFIFAGGNHPTMASFKDRAIELPGVKATDFLSRLRGYVDILGPNPVGDADRAAVLRRALLLRTLLQMKAPRLVQRTAIDIDPGVLRAFLDVPAYVHGARSMESVIDMSTLAGKLRFERSALPPQHQLSLHVDADAFLGLVQQPSGGYGKRGRGM